MRIMVTLKVEAIKRQCLNAAYFTEDNRTFEATSIDFEYGVCCICTPSRIELPLNEVFLKVQESEESSACFCE